MSVSEHYSSRHHIQGRLFSVKTFPRISPSMCQFEDESAVIMPLEFSPRSARHLRGPRINKTDSSCLHSMIANTVSTSLIRTLLNAESYGAVVSGTSSGKSPQPLANRLAIVSQSFLVPSHMHSVRKSSTRITKSKVSWNDGCRINWDMRVGQWSNTYNNAVNLCLKIKVRTQCLDMTTCRI